jgi:hypothetical protein
LKNSIPDETVRIQVEHVMGAEPPTQLVARLGIGRFGYWSGLPILDLVGLVDAHIARASSSGPGSQTRRKNEMIIPGHQRSDPDYVFNRRPDFIFIRQRDRNGIGIQLPAVLDLWADPRLMREYHYDRFLLAYVRNDRARRVRGGSGTRARSLPAESGPSR